MGKNEMIPVLGTGRLAFPLAGRGLEGPFPQKVEGNAILIRWMQGKLLFLISNLRREDMEMEEGKFIASNELKVARIKECPIKAEDNLIIDDRLEEQGTLQMHEYIGGNIYLEPGILKEAPLVAGISIKRSGSYLRIDKIFHEYGHQELVPLLRKQIVHFAEFYGLKIEPLDLKKSRGFQNYG